jgi:hypothetical protein
LLNNFAWVLPNNRGAVYGCQRAFFCHAKPSVGRLAARGRAERRGLPARGELTAAFRALRGPMNRHRLSHPRPRDPAASHANRQQSIQTAGRAPVHRGAHAAGVRGRRPAIGSRDRDGSTARAIRRRTTCVCGSTIAGDLTRREALEGYLQERLSVCGVACQASQNEFRPRGRADLQTLGKHQPKRPLPE